MNDKTNPPGAGEPPLPLDATGFSVVGIASALPDFAFAGAFFITWVAPYAFGQQMISYLMLVMVVEFIIVHSSALMGGVMVGNAMRTRKNLLLISLGVFYSLFVGGFALSFKQ